VLELRNKNKFPVQLIVRSRRAPRAFTTLNIPGVGSGQNVYLLEDERETPYIQRVEDLGLITTRRIPTKLRNGE
jgi:hypothetical protein